MTKSGISGVKKYGPQTEREKTIEKNNIFDYLILGSSILREYHDKVMIKLKGNKVKK